MANKSNNPFADSFKALGEFRMPSPDLKAWSEFCKRNVETLTTANQLVAESLQSVARRQAESAQAAGEDMLKEFRKAISAGSPETSASHQAEYFRKSLEEAAANLREAGEIISKASSEAAELLSKRVSEALSELSEVCSASACASNSNASSSSGSHKKAAA